MLCVLFHSSFSPRRKIFILCICVETQEESREESSFMLSHISLRKESLNHRGNHTNKKNGIRLLKEESKINLTVKYIPFSSVLLSIECIKSQVKNIPIGKITNMDSFTSLKWVLFSKVYILSNFYILKYNSVST